MVFRNAIPSTFNSGALLALLDASWCNLAAGAEKRALLSVPGCDPYGWCHQSFATPELEQSFWPLAHWHSPATAFSKGGGGQMTSNEHPTVHPEENIRWLPSFNIIDWLVNPINHSQYEHVRTINGCLKLKSSPHEAHMVVVYAIGRAPHHNPMSLLFFLLFLLVFTPYKTSIPD